MPRRARMTARLAGLAAVLLLLVLCAPASADETFVVDNGGDGHDLNPGDGVCDGSPNGDPAFCTLRAAVEEANALPGTDSVNFDVDEVQLTIAGGGAIEISSNLTIEGRGALSTSISQESVGPDSGDRVFDIGADFR